MLEAHKGLLTVSDAEMQFPVAKRTLAFKGADGRYYDDPDRIAVVREDPRMPTRPLVLGVHGAGYELIPHMELFDRMESDIGRFFGREGVHDVDITRRNYRAFFGARIGRTYTITPSRQTVKDIGDLSLTLWCRNSYDGNSRFRFGWSVEECVCTNQLTVAIGKEMYVRRHTKGFEIENVTQTLERFMESYDAQRKRIGLWADVRVKDKDHVMALFAAFPGASNTWGERMMGHALEGQQFPLPFWRIVSTITYWATHGIVRNVRPDNATATHWDRQAKVAEWLRTTPVRGLLENAA